MHFHLDSFTEEKMEMAQIPYSKIRIIEIVSTVPFVLNFFGPNYGKQFHVRKWQLLVEWNATICNLAQISGNIEIFSIRANLHTQRGETLLKGTKSAISLCSQNTKFSSKRKGTFFARTKIFRLVEIDQL